MTRAWRVIVRRWSAAVWALAAWFASRQRGRATREQVARVDFRSQTRGMGLHVNEWLRDRLRPGWLRVRRARATDE